MNDGSWLCDTCGDLIEKPEHGWVEWLSNSEGDRREHGLRLVHHAPFSPLRPQKNCQYDQDLEFGHQCLISDEHLTEFLGPDGLMYLLSWIEGGRLPQQEVMELIRRLHIPGYEFARNHLNAAIAKGIIDSILLPGYYLQSQINAVLEWRKDAADQDE